MANISVNLDQSGKLVELDQRDSVEFDLGQKDHIKFGLGQADQSEFSLSDAQLVYTGLRWEEDPIDGGLVKYNEETDKYSTVTPDSVITEESEVVSGKAIIDYVKENGGKIDTISVNGENIEIDPNKNVNIPVATKTSELTNDGDGESPFATEEYVDTKVADLVNSAPETLDTLGELATAFEENKDVVDALNSAIATKADKTELQNYVDLTSDQKITGQKKFSNIGILGEGLVPIYEDRETTVNYEYAVENIPSSNAYGFVLNEAGYYESNNKGVDNSYAMCKVSFNMWVQNDLTIELINYAESNYDFGIFSQLDQYLSESNTEDTSATLVYKSYNGIQSATPTTLTYSQVPAGEHFITIKYKKDSSAHNSNDSLQFKITSPIGEITTIVPTIVGYEDHNATIDVDADLDLTYDGDKIITQSKFDNYLPEGFAHFRGTYDASTQYYSGDTVSVNENVFLAKEDNIGVQPPTGSPGYNNTWTYVGPNTIVTPTSTSSKWYLIGSLNAQYFVNPCIFNYNETYFNGGDLYVKNIRLANIEEVSNQVNESKPKLITIGDW